MDNYSREDIQKIKAQFDDANKTVEAGITLVETLKNLVATTKMLRCQVEALERSCYFEERMKLTDV